MLRLSRGSASTFLAFLLSALWIGSALGTLVTPAHRPDRILVKPKADTPAVALEEFHSRNHVKVLHTFQTFGGIQVLQIPAEGPVQVWVNRYRDSGLVEFAQPDYVVSPAATFPNDPKFLDGTLWPLHNEGQNDGTADADIDAPEAWDLRHCASNIIVAVLDTGIRYTHEDLAANMWVSPHDGSHGYNAFTGSNDPFDDDGHGTLTAGVLGAVGNNGIGIAGVAWRVQLMAGKCLDNRGYGSDSTVIASLEFAQTNGAHIINASLGISTYSEALSNAIVSLRDAGILLVVSAGNNSADLDLSPRYPACYDLENIISVAFTTRDDTLGIISNFGAESVDLAAPGDEIYSTYAASDSSYYPTNPMMQNVVGSSFAAAHVSGALALMMARFPTESPMEIRGRLLEAVDPLPALQGKCLTGGRLNLRKALSPDIQLTVLPRAGGEVFDLSVRCGPNRTCVIEASNDFVFWQPVFTNSTGTNVSFEFSAVVDTNCVPRYYRAVSDP